MPAGVRLPRLVGNQGRTFRRPDGAGPRALCVCDRGWVQGAALHASGAAPRRHELDALFRALPRELQTQIIADTSATYPGHIALETRLEERRPGPTRLHRRTSAHR